MSKDVVMSNDTVMYNEADALTDIPARFIDSELESPMSAAYLAFTEELSKNLFSSDVGASDNLKALGFWLRPAAQKKLKQEFECLHQGHIALPLGTIFQVAPGNTETQFIYSTLLALALGNRVAVRLSSRDSEELTQLLSLLVSVLSEERFISIKQRLLLFKSSHDSHWIRSLSNICDLRVLWGGNDSIAQLRQIPLAPSAKDLAFSNRYSICLLSAAEICQADSIDMFLERLERDVNTFDQQACSSPLALVWIGDDEQVVKARQRFVDAVTNRELQGYKAASQSALVAKQSTAQAIAMLCSVNRYQAGEWAVLRLERDSDITEDLFKLHDGNGVLLDLAYSSVEGFEKHLLCNPQTLSFYGYERTELIKSLGVVGLHKIDRIEILGNSLDFNEIWDGINFLHEFCKTIR